MLISGGELTDCLHATWEMAAVHQFMTLFSQALNMPEFTPDELEFSLLYPHANLLLPEIHLRLLVGSNADEFELTEVLDERWIERVRRWMATQVRHTHPLHTRPTHLLARLTYWPPLPLPPHSP